jgi:hypothetical protein
MKTFDTIWVSYFEDLRNIHPQSSFSLEEIFHLVKSPKWQHEIANCKKDPTNKQKLPSFTPTGVFSQRNNNGLIRYSGIICLDIDHVNDVISLKERCKQIPWIWCSFITPSSSGLKVFVRTHTHQDDFKWIEAEIAISFYDLTGFLRDDKAKDLARLQFVSHDEYLYLNNDAKIWERESPAL